MKASILKFLYAGCHLGFQNGGNRPGCHMSKCIYICLAPGLDHFIHFDNCWIIHIQET